MSRTLFFSFLIVTIVFPFAAFANKASAADSREVFSESLLVGNEILGEMRGTALSPEILGIAVLDAISTNNTSTGTVSGGNIINAGAFSQSSGLSTVIQNSGNNVLIQSATILNVKIN